MDLKSRLGYPCINMKLQEEENIYTNRHMIKKTFEAQCATNESVSKLALQNVKDLVKIIQWNHQNGIKFFRMSSNIFPWASEYEIEHLPDWKLIEKNLQLAGSLADQFGQRLTFHPGPFNVLASTNPLVVKKTIRDLNQHSQIMDIMGLSITPWAKINIHINTTQGGKEECANRFCQNFELLDKNTKARIVVENDDKPSQYSVKDLFDLVHKRIGIPITFDVHHHKFCNSGLDHEMAAGLAVSTWPKGIPPVFHFASSIKHEQPDKIARAHADWIYEEITDYGTGAWIMCECKSKERAIQAYMNEGVNTSSYQEIHEIV